jgi:hypothetical protein
MQNEEQVSVQSLDQTKFIETALSKLKSKLKKYQKQYNQALQVLKLPTPEELFRRNKESQKRKALSISTQERIKKLKEEIALMKTKHPSIENQIINLQESPKGKPEASSECHSGIELIRNTSPELRLISLRKIVNDSRELLESEVHKILKEDSNKNYILAQTNKFERIRIKLEKENKELAGIKDAVKKSKYSLVKQIFRYY